MVNASVKIQTVQALLLKRSLDSGNDLVRGLSGRVYRDTLPFVDVNTNFFAISLKELSSLLYTSLSVFS